MTQVRRSSWLNARAALLVGLLNDRHGMVIDEDIARHDISDHLDYVAEMMRVGRQAAKFYLTDDVITGLADHIAEEVQQRRRGVVDLDAERHRRR